MTSLRELNRWNSKNTTHLYPLEKNNFRPTQPLYRRPVRTNISPYKEVRIANIFYTTPKRMFSGVYWN